MLICEDTPVNEIKQFFVVDAAIQLGLVKVGNDVRNFDLPRVLSYFSRVENQLLDFASNYPSSFRYLPRRAYDYLKKPPILSELYETVLDSSESSWLIDQFFVRPMISIAGNPLSSKNRGENTNLTYEWSTDSPFSSRLYYCQDMREGRSSSVGWACVLDIKDLSNSLRGSNRTDLLSYIREGQPVFIELIEPDDLDPLLEWLIYLKESGVESPKLILSAKSHQKWGDQITRLLDVPNSKILTSGSTLSSLSTIVKYLKKKGDSTNWSSRLVFGSSYPETQEGDGVSVVLSFLLSKNLDAKPGDIQKILGGNLLALIPPRPQFLHYIENSASVVAEGGLGKASMNELSRIFQILSARKIQSIVSVDYMIMKEGEVVDTNGVIVTVKDPTSKQGNSMGLIVERDYSLKISGWKRTFTESLTERKGDIFTTLIRASTKSGGVVLDSPSHLNRFNQVLLTILKVRNPQEVLSALHFTVTLSEVESGSIIMSPSDMRALDVTPNGLVIALETQTGQWWAARAISEDSYPARTIGVSDEDSVLLSLDNPVVDLLKYEGEVVELEKAIFSFESTYDSSIAETSSFVYLHDDMIKGSLQKRLLGKGTKFNFNENGNALTMTMVDTEPTIETGQLASLANSIIEFRPAQVFNELNIVLCILTNQDMDTKDIDLKTLYSLKQRLSALSNDIPDLEKFLSKLNTAITRSEAAILLSLLTVHALSVNRTEGKLGLLIAGESLRKFTIQRGESIQSFAEYATDLQSEEVLISLIYTILDSQQELKVKGKLTIAFRAIAEVLEDLGSDQPTLVMLLTSNLTEDNEDISPFIRAISRNERYHLDAFGLGNEFNTEMARKRLEGIKFTLYPMTQFSAYYFDQYLLSAIDRMFSMS